MVVPLSVNGWSASNKYARAPKVIQKALFLASGENVIQAWIFNLASQVSIKYKIYRKEKKLKKYVFNFIYGAFKPNSKNCTFYFGKLFLCTTDLEN